MDPRYMRIEDDSDSSFSCGPTPPNPNNDNDTSCILRLSPESLQPDSLPGTVTAPPWQQPSIDATSAGGLRNLVYDQAFAPVQGALDAQQLSLDDVINNAALPDNLESVPPLDLTQGLGHALDLTQAGGHTLDLELTQTGADNPNLELIEPTLDSADISTDVTAEPRPISSSSEGSAEESLNLLGAPLAEPPPEEQLLPPGSVQALDGLEADAALRKPSYHEMEAEYDCFPDWNWPVIRNSLVGISAAVWLALLGVCIGWIVSMPRKCDPFRKWYQGEVLYEVFPGSFQDSDGDGIGDLRGLQSRLYYIHGLGASTIVLSGLLHTEQYLENSEEVLDFTLVEPKFGSDDDFVSVIADAHAMKLHVILALNPLPLLNESNDFNLNITHSQMQVKYPAFQHVLEYWLRHGVDGFLLRGLEDGISDSPPSVDVERLVKDARLLLDRYTQGMEDKILVVPLTLAQTLATKGERNASDVLQGVDLLDCLLDVEDHSPKEIAAQINQALAWDESAMAPWLAWRLTSGSERRLSSRLGGHHTVGATLLQTLLPGTVTLLYGDEVCVEDGTTLTENNTTTAPTLTKMPWSDAAVSADFSLDADKPWLPLPEEHVYNSISTQNVSIQAVKRALQVHRTAVPVYVNGIFESVGDFHPTRSSNLQVRHVDDAVIVLNRFYPRQPRWGVVYNTASTPVTRDLSHIFFRGLVKASSTGQKQGHIRFQELHLEAGEGVLFELDR